MTLKMKHPEAKLQQPHDAKPQMDQYTLTSPEKQNRKRYKPAVIFGTSETHVSDVITHSLSFDS